MVDRYVPPSRDPGKRRVYLLPPDLVRRIHDYGRETGARSEVEAVRELLRMGLELRAPSPNKGGE